MNYQRDSDGDRLPDSCEFTFPLDPWSEDALSDSDSDFDHDELLAAGAAW